MWELFSFKMNNSYYTDFYYYFKKNGNRMKYSAKVNNLVSHSKLRGANNFCAKRLKLETHCIKMLHFGCFEGPLLGKMIQGF